ncbi:MAG: lipopolysaccharide biosynthesis protein [Anaerolineae bacterium]|nr:lipopolysaccharide biosynthesis protein [Anaerolineae bacterium]
MVRLILVRLLESYFRHRWLYLLPIVIMIIAATVFTLTKEPLYLTEGVLHVNRDSLINSLTIDTNNSFSWQTPAEQKTTEINDLLKTDAFIRAIVSQTDLESEMSGGSETIKTVLTDVRDAVWVKPEGNDQLLISATYKDPNITHQLVNAIVDNYVNWQINVQVTESANAQEFFKDLTQEYKSDLEYAQQELDGYLLSHPEPERGSRPQIEQVQISRLESEVQMAADRYVSSIRNEELARLAIIQAENTIKQSYFLVDAPKIPTSPETSLRAIAANALLFVVVGVLISGVGIVGGALLDRSFRVPLDVNQLLNLPVLATVPDVSKAVAQERSLPVSERDGLTKFSNSENKQEKLRDPQPVS